MGKGQREDPVLGHVVRTILGQTFATMYPDRIGRFVLDGVANTTEYYRGSLSTAQADAEAISGNFTASCVAAGSSICPLAMWIASNDSTALLSEFLARLESLRTSPISGIVNTVPIVVTHSDFINAVLLQFHCVLKGYKNVSSALPLLLATRDPLYFCALSHSCFKPFGAMESTASQQTAILCTDAYPHFVNATKADFLASYATIKATSLTYANYLAPVLMPCRTYTSIPKWRLPSYKAIGGVNTTAPILFASQTLDPITPLRNAEEAVTFFEGAELLEAQGVGHTLLGWQNVCAEMEIKRYLREGNVSSERVVCAPKLRPFEDTMEVDELENKEQEEMQSAFEELLTGWRSL